MELMVNLLMPGIIALTALWGMARRVDVYDALVTGAGEGLGVLIRIVPPMIGLLTAVYMLRASGALELAAQALGPVLELLGIPPETVALLLVRPVSGSAALGVGAELISTYGPTPPSAALQPSCWAPPRPPSTPSPSTSVQPASPGPDTQSLPPCAPIWWALPPPPLPCGCFFRRELSAVRLRLL